MPAEAPLSRPASGQPGGDPAADRRGTGDRDDPAGAVVVAIVLAAGRSVRMETAHTKLVEPIDGRPLVAWPVAALREAGVRQVFVVTGFEAERVEAALGGQGCVFVRHAGWAEGMGSSLARAARRILDGSPRPEAILVCVGDLPGLRPAHVAAVLAAARDASGRFAPDRITLPTHAGQRGHPVAFGADWLEALARLGGDEGARSLLRAHADRVVEVPVDDAGCLRDVDTPADLATARTRPRA